MENSATILLENFRKQKVSQESEVLQSAQRFVNQYRALNFFDPSFVEQFNNQLLASSPDVRRFFTSIMGGNEVLNYLEFLEKQQPQTLGQDSDNQSQMDIATDGYLPQPEADLSSQSTSQTFTVTQEQWHSIQEQQKLLMQQTQQLMRQLNGQSQTATTPIERYSEIIDE